MQVLFYFTVLVCLSTSTGTNIYVLDERWVCIIKRSCLDCLRLPQCSWCKKENNCFSEHLPSFDNYCMDNMTSHQDFGLSLDENAQCACDPEMEQNCYPPGVTEGSECSGRGTCVCGRCACDATPDIENPTKMVMGEFCEFDNFSCDGPKCNEGPYSLHEPRMAFDADELDEM